MTKESQWNFEWVDISPDVDLYVRYRLEETLDKMPKLNTESLAYIIGTYDHMAPQKYWDYTAFIYKKDYNDDPEPLFETTIEYKSLKREVEEYFRNKPDEDSNVPASTER